MSGAGDNVEARLRLRLLMGGAMLGPGKVDLLEHIRDTGSISAAGRMMGMSYKRAWSLVEEMNLAYRAPLVGRTRGGPGGGGAHLTEAGVAVVAAFRGLERRAAEAGAAEIALLTGMLRDMSGGK